MSKTSKAKEFYKDEDICKSLLFSFVIEIGMIIALNSLIYKTNSAFVINKLESSIYINYLLQVKILKIKIILKIFSLFPHFGTKI